MPQTLRLVIVVVCVLITGCRSVPDDTVDGEDSGKSAEQLIQASDDAWAATPRTRESVTKALEASRMAIETNPRSYAALWRASRCVSWLAVYAATDDDEDLIREGLRYANTAVEVQPDGDEGVYFRVVLVGLLAEQDNSYGSDAVDEILAATDTLIERESMIEHAGAWRIAGVLRLRAPGPPLSHGSLRKARKLLRKAVEIAPDWPENQLYLAELELAWGEDKDDEESRASGLARLDEHFPTGDTTTHAPDGYATEYAHWHAHAETLRREYSED